MTSQVSGVRLAEKQEEEINILIENGIYLSASEFIREAVREKLEAIKVINVRENVNRKQAKKEIINYLAKNKEAYGSDIAEALSLDLNMIFEILKELKKEGAVE